MIEKQGFINEDFDEYLKSDGMSSSRIVQLTRSAHEYEYFTHNKIEETPSMRLGRMLHFFILEPNKFTDLYAVTPELENYPRALKSLDDLKTACKQYGLKTSGTKAELMALLKTKDSTLQFWDEILDHHKRDNKTLLTKTEYNLLLGLEKSIMKHTMIKKILADGIPEMSGYWTDSEYNIKGKMRADWLTEKGYIVDLKTTSNGSLRKWQHKLIDYRYDIQAAWYCRGFEQIKQVKPKGFIHFIVEVKPPYNIYCYLADNTVLECGETGGNNSIGYKQALDLYAKCVAQNFWPMPQSEIEIENMPDYFI